MTKKTKKAAKPRLKTKTFSEFGVVDTRSGCLGSARFLTMEAARNHIAVWYKHFCAARITITYEVRR